MRRIINRTFAFLCSILLLISISSCSCVNQWKEHQNEEAMMEYMNKTPRKNNVAYVDEIDTVNILDSSIKASDDVVFVLYVTSMEIFYFAKDNGKDYVYKTDHDGTNKTVVLSTNEDIVSIHMPDENKIFYHFMESEEYYIRDLKDNSTVEITKEKFNAYYYENDFYRVDIEETRTGVITEYRITNKATGETKIVNEKQRQEILKTEMASKLCEYTELAFTMFVLKNDKIYIVCHGGYDIITMYSYDFETEKIEFFDWYRMEGLTGSIGKIFVF